MKKWAAYLRKALSKDEVKRQFRPGSALSKLFLFSFVASLTLGVIYNFVYQYLGGTQASTETLTVNVSASKEQLAINEEFTFNILFTAPAGKKISQLDLRAKVYTPENAVAYVPGSYESSAVGSADTKYFDTEVIQEHSGTTEQTLRLVLSSRKPEALLSDKVIVKLKFKALANGTAKYTLYSDTMEIVGPSVSSDGAPISYVIGSNGSKEDATVRIGASAPTATQGPAGPSPTITIAPAPSCRGAGSINGTMARCDFDYSRISIISHDEVIA
jgi:hypothetical protein